MQAHPIKKTLLIFTVAFLLPSCGTKEVAVAAPGEPYDYEGAVYPFELSPLPYAYDALEPHIDGLTMHIHHDKHYKSYIDNLNAALSNYPNLQTKTLKDLVSELDELPEEILTQIVNQGGGVYNHAMFWTMMSPDGGGQPQGAIAKALVDNFGTFDEFKNQFTQAAKKVFGSGWVWLCVDAGKKLQIIASPNQNNPLAEGLTPILCLDVWEHAYYLKYQNRRPDYIDAWWNVVNWPLVEQHYQNAVGGA